MLEQKMVVLLFSGLALLLAYGGGWLAFGLLQQPRQTRTPDILISGLALAAVTFASNVLNHAALLGPSAVNLFTHELALIFVIPLVGGLVFSWAAFQGHAVLACMFLAGGVLGGHLMLIQSHDPGQWLLSALVLVVCCGLSLRLVRSHPPFADRSAGVRRVLAALLFTLGLTASFLIPEVRGIRPTGGHDIVVLSGLVAACGLMLLYLYFFDALRNGGLSFWRMWGAIVAAEIGIMFLLPALFPPGSPAWMEAISDGSLLSVFLVPLLLREQRAGQALEETSKQLAYKSDLQQAVNALLSLRLDALSLDEVASRSLDVLLELSWLPVEPRAGIFLSEPEGHLRLAAQRKLSAEVRGNCARIRSGYCLCGRAAATGELQFKSCLDHEHEFRHEGMADHGHYNVPLIGEGMVQGVLVLYLATGHHRKQREVDVLSTLGHTLGGLIARKRLGDRQRLAQQILDSGAQGMMVTDPDLKILEVNPAFTKVTGYPPEEVLGQTPAVLKSGRHDKGFYRAMWATIEREGSWQGEIWNRRKDNSIYPEWLVITRLDDQNGQVQKYIGTFTDLTALKRAEGHIEALAYSDALTGLANRHRLRESKKRALARAGRSGGQVALLFIDLDRFKIINDTYGHGMGDVVLKVIGARISASLRQDDLAARAGGDEFVILLEGGASEEIAIKAGRVAEKLLHEIAMPIHIETHEFHLSASIGIALYPDDAGQAEELLQYADATMYQVKRAEPGQYRFFSRQANAGMQRRVRMEAALREAGSRGELELYYQPKVRLRDESLVGAEALLRWHSPEFGEVSPVEFIPLAEESVLILAIGSWVLEAACRQKREWLDAGLCTDIPGAHIAVNIAARQLQSSTFVIQARALLEKYGLGEGAIQLELTETGLMHRSTRIVDELHALKLAGFSLAIDDFGTGYSSLARLKDFPIDLIKIDRAFVCDISTDAGDAGIVRATIDMGRALGIAVCAEGPETQEQIDYLRRFGCDYAQGYYYARPSTASEIATLLQQGGDFRVGTGIA